jgi:cyanophycin synthetase
MRAARAHFYSTMWRTAAKDIGAHLVSSGGDQMEIWHSGQRLVVNCNKTSIDDMEVAARAADKIAVHTLLMQGNIPVPRQISLGIDEIDRAVELLKSSTRPLVVKPGADTGGGAGVSTSIQTRYQLLKAIAWARAYARRVLIEDQIPGDCYRVLVMDGEVLDTVLRRPPTVIGDGISTVRQLIRCENNLRRRSGAAQGQVLIRIDLDLQNTIMVQGLTLESRPRDGEVVILKRVVNDNGTLENVSANGVLCPAILESARRAAELVGARLSGVDIMCSNTALPLECSGGAIIEVNANPGLYYHYRSTAVTFPVTEQVLRRYFNISTSCRGERQLASTPARSIQDML